MAGWSDLLTFSPLPRARIFFLCSGEVSSLVWDALNRAIQEYDLWIRVESEEDLRTSLATSYDSLAYVAVNPSEGILRRMEGIARSSSTDSFFILFEGDIPSELKESVEYLKKKAQQSKQYYTVTAPKTETAREKMQQFFQMRWAVTRETSYRVCSALEYSPGKLYQFDKQFMLCTEGRVLPSTRTEALVTEIIGQDNPNMVMANIANRTRVNELFDAPFTERVLKYLHLMTQCARLIQKSWKLGNTTTSNVGKNTKIPQFQVLQAWGLAETYSAQQLRRCEDLILFGLENTQDNPEVLALVSRLWGK